MRGCLRCSEPFGITHSDYTISASMNYKKKISIDDRLRDASIRDGFNLKNGWKESLKKKAYLDISILATAGRIMTLLVVAIDKSRITYLLDVQLLLLIFYF